MHGQQVPILVRPHPEREGRYQIAYGRRRLRALTELGRPVRAVVRPLSDQQLVVAQGQENSARTDLSFIERALFAAKLEQVGYDRETIMAALSVDKTTLSRLVSTASRIPRSLVESIGPAPKAGRDRWIELATRLEAVGRLKRVEEAVAKDSFAIPAIGRSLRRRVRRSGHAVAKGFTSLSWSRQATAHRSGVSRRTQLV